MLLLQAFYTIGSDRQLMEQLDYNLLFRWFVGLGIDDPVWSPTRHASYRVSQQKRKLVEQGFGWMKTVGGLRKAALQRRPVGDLGLHLRRGRRQHRPVATAVPSTV